METSRVCYCGAYAKVRTSWTDLNPGRRFWGCKNGGCVYFDWVDPPMCARSKALIPGLLRKINVVEAANERIKSRERKWICCVFICVIMIFFLLINSGDVEDHGSSKTEV